MRNLFRADARRMLRGRAFWRSLLAMLLISAGMVWMQATAMDYTVPLSRVIFLSQTFYGLVAAALASAFVSEDFASGVLRNKLIAGHGRSAVYLSNLLAVSAASLALFALSSAFTAALALPFFEADVSPVEVLAHLALGLPMCLAYASIFCLLSTLMCDRTRSVIACTALAFGMLVACMELNSILVHADAAAASGLRLRLCAFAYDLLPTGQAAQLSMMKFLNPLRSALLSVAWVAATVAAGCARFRRMDIR